MAVINIFNSDNTYDLLLIDPPWIQGRGGKKKVRPNSSGGGLPYPTLDLETIKQHMEAGTKLTTENSLLFLWTTERYLIDAQRIAEELGYKLHIRMIWSKYPMGLAPAFTVRFGHEYLLYMYKGKLTPIAKEERGQIHSVFTAQPQRHSQKPEISFEIIERMYPEAKKLEMYARQERDGWDCWGNEV